MMDIAWSQQQRFSFIERQLLWGRQLQARMICDAFGVSRYQAGLDIKAYQKLAPENIKQYSPADRCYKPTLQFDPMFASQKPQELLTVVKGGKGKSSSLEAVPQLNRTIPHGVLPVVMSALEERRTMEVVYASASAPMGSKRLLTPTAIAYVDNRLHVRAYCSRRKEYRDFVLSRFLTIPRLLDSTSAETLPKDNKWDEKLTIELIANPALNEDGRALIEREYRIENTLEVQVRRSLVHYFLQTNLLPHSQELHKSAQQSPWSFPVVVKNWDEISSCLF